MEDTRYYDLLAGAYVRGCSARTGTPELPPELSGGRLSELSPAGLQELVRIGEAAGLKIYRFKATGDELPRVRKVLGFLRGIAFESLLDVGSGRGVFLFPFMMQFPWVQVVSADILPHRVELLQDVARGGAENLSVLRADICEQPLVEKSVDVVTLLEVLEHIPDVDKAVRSAVKIARKFVVVTVPSKEDDNPEHIHLLTKKMLTELFADAGCTRLNFDGVNGHLIMIASL